MSEQQPMHKRPSGPKPRAYQWHQRKQWWADVLLPGEDYRCKLFRSHAEALRQANEYARMAQQ